MSANPIEGLTFPLQMDAATANGRTIVHCTGKLVQGTCDYFTAEAKRLAERSHTLVLELGGLSYMDSSGVGALVNVFSSVRCAKCECRLVNVTPRVMDLLQLTNLHKVLRPTAENLL